MYLTKSITTPSGITGGVVKAAYTLCDSTTSHLTVHLMLYASAATLAMGPTQALCMIGKFRASGAAFTALCPTGTPPTEAALYAAIQAGPLIAGAGLASLSLSAAALVTP